MVKLGITGGLGSGKSTAAAFFKEFGAVVFDADVIAKTLINKNAELQEKLKNAFGAELFRNDGTLNRSALAEAAFSSRENQQKLNLIIHPYVLHELYKIFQEEEGRRTKLVVVEASMLFEAKSEGQYDMILVVTASEKTRLLRSFDRSTLTQEQIKKRISFQMPEEEKISRSDYVVYNEGSIAELKRKCRDIYKMLNQ